MVKTSEHFKSMNYAIFMMMNHKKGKFTSKMYEKVKTQIAKSMSENNPMYDPEVAIKFRKKRPDQSLVAKQRNEEYWKIYADRFEKLIA